MSIFTLNWFKSEKQKELEGLKVEGQKLKNEILRKKITPKVVQEENVISSHMDIISAKLVNDILVATMKDGRILTKQNATSEDFNNMLHATTESQLNQIFSTSEGISEHAKNEEEKDKVVKIHSNIQILVDSGDFEFRNDAIYMKEVNRSMPELLIEQFASLFQKYNGLDVLRTGEYQSLKNFFLWCCLNPRAEVANDLYNFLYKNSFRITKQGFFVALRNVVTVHTENEEDRNLVEFISNSYNKTRAIWKKKPSYFDVYKQDDEYLMHLRQKEDSSLTYDGELLGDLESLYKDLPNMLGNRYTDAHTETFDIRVGRVVSMPMNLCDWSTADCSTGGLHFTADNIHYVGCGDTSVLVLINPMTVVGIGEQKGRCYEYLPIMTVPSNEATEILHDGDFDTLELDEEYAIKCLEGLSEKTKDGFAAETTKYSFNLPQISTEEIQGIVNSLEKMKESISKRVNVIK
jgi:hypothetical protein